MKRKRKQHDEHDEHDENITTNVTKAAKQKGHDEACRRMQHINENNTTECSSTKAA
jgi:hypothetical protein